MSISSEVAIEIAKVVVAFGVEAWNALSDDGKKAVREAMERNREALDAAPDVLARVEAAIAAARTRVQAHEQAHEQAHANAIMERMRVAPTTELALRNLAQSHALSSEERVEVGIAHRLVRAALDGRLAITPGPLDPPTLPGAAPLPLALFGEPAHEED